MAHTQCFQQNQALLKSLKLVEIIWILGDKYKLLSQLWDTTKDSIFSLQMKINSELEAPNQSYV